MNYQTQSLSIEPRTEYDRQLDRIIDLNLDVIPDDFVQADIKVKGKRHLLIATSFMLSLLVTAKNWFVDGTFKVVRAPFTQLFSIHAFIRQGDNLKQIPLVYFLMSGKSTTDYEAIFKALLGLLAGENLGVKTVTLDFEAATWLALRNVFPSVCVRGCLFHWNQAIWRHLQHLGLVSSYMKKDSAYKFCRRVMALPFLPAESIYPMFCSLKSTVRSGPYANLMEYIDQTWMKSSVWPIESWCVFKRTVCTNNDCEGWHRRLNNLAPGQSGLNLYFLIQILYRETRFINGQVRFVSEGKILRYQRCRYVRHQGVIVKAWEDFEAENFEGTPWYQWTCCIKLKTLSPICRSYMGLGARKRLRGVENKSADQSAHLRSLISTFVSHLLETFIPKLATHKSSLFKLVSVVEQAVLIVTLYKPQ